MQAKMFDFTRSGKKRGGSVIADAAVAWQGRSWSLLG